MGIEKLKGSLLSEATKEADQLVQAADSQAAELLREERAKSTAMKAAAEKEILRLLEDQRNERTAWARLEAKRLLAEAKEDAIKTVFEDIFDALGKVRKTAEYRTFLKKSVETAAAELGPGVIIHVCPGDKGLVPKVKSAEVEEDLEGLGGAVVESSDGKVRVNLTLETLVEMRRDDLRKQVYAELFGGK